MSETSPDLIDDEHPDLEDHGPVEVENDDVADDQPDLPADDVATDDVDIAVDVLTDLGNQPDEAAAREED